MLPAIGRQLLLFVALLLPLEVLFPLRKNHLRRGLFTDLCYFVLNPFLIAFGGALLLALLSRVLPRVHIDQPWTLQVVEIFVASEFLGYWVHRLSHSMPFLWRFHSVHHSNSQLDFLAAHRQHPLEAIWLVGVANLPILALGFDTEPLLGFILVQKIYTAFLHANVRVRFGWGTNLLASPQFHHWHHDLHVRGNFSSALPIFDRLFGTYRLPSGFPSEYGCDSQLPRAWLGQLLHPLSANSRAPARAAAAPSPRAPTPAA